MGCGVKVEECREHRGREEGGGAWSFLKPINTYTPLRLYPGG